MLEMIDQSPDFVDEESMLKASGIVHSWAPLWSFLIDIDHGQSSTRSPSTPILSSKSGKLCKSDGAPPNLG